MKKNVFVSPSTVSQDYGLNPQHKNVAIIFGPKNSINAQIAKELKKQDPNVIVAGLSTSNCFVGSETGTPDQMTVSIIELKKTDAHSVCVPNTGGYSSSKETAQKVADLLLAKSTPEKPLSGVLIFSEGLNINGADIPRPYESLGIPVCGGLAAETDFAFKSTSVFHGDQTLSDHVVAVGFYGTDFVMESFASSGMAPIGVFKKITKSNKNVLIEVDGKPAVDWYKSYLTSFDPSKALSYPIAIFKEGDKVTDGAIRTPVGFNVEVDGVVVPGSIAFTGEIPQGFNLKMMLANPQALITKADDSVAELEESGTEDCNILHLSCSARQMLLKQLTENEYASAKDCAGGYVYGEIVTLKGQVPTLVNQTFTSIKIKEAS